MKNMAINLIYLAVVALLATVVFKLGNIVVGPVFPSTLAKLTNTILLFAIALAVTKK